MFYSERLIGGAEEEAGRKCMDGLTASEIRYIYIRDKWTA